MALRSIIKTLLAASFVLGCICYQSVAVATEEDDPTDHVDALISDLLGPDLVAAVEAADELLTMSDDEKAIQALVQALDINLMVSVYVSSHLRQVGDAAVPFLIDALEDPDRRYFAINSLTYVESPHPEVIPMVIVFLKDTDTNVQSACLSYLYWWGDGGTDVSYQVAGLIKSDDDVVRSKAVDAAVWLGYCQAHIFEALLYNVVNYNDTGRWQTLRAITLLSPAPEYIAEQFENSLVGLPVIEFDPMTELLFPSRYDQFEWYQREDVWTSCIFYLHDSTRTELIGHIISHLQSTDRVVQTSAAEALGLIGPPAMEAIPELERLLNDDNARWHYGERATIEEALRRIRGEELVDEE